MSQRILLIYNPRAGKGPFLSALSSVIDLFTKAGLAVEVYPTQGPGDAVNKIAGLRDDYAMIVPAGGDGTLDEIVTGLMRGRKDIPVGYIPVGSTNDFASSLSLSNNIIEAVGDIIDGEPRGIDVGIFNIEHVFIYIAAFGAFTEVAYETNQDLKNMFGHAAYLLEATKRLADLKAYEIQVNAENYSMREEYIFGMVTNSISVGGIKNITGTDVRLDDGLFEVTLIRNPKNILELQEIIGCLLMQNRDTDLIDSFKTSWVELEAVHEIPWTMDGEYGGSWKRVRIENRKQAFRLLLEPERAFIGEN